MSRVYPREPRECDSCDWFQCEVKPAKAERDASQIVDVGRCTHPDGPLEARMTRVSRPESVSAMTRIVSSGMTCSRFEDGEA